jgi:hypothetical protein
VLAHHSVISLGIVAQARESIPALLADAALADTLRPYVNVTATELAAIGRGLPISVPLDGAGQGGRHTAAPPASRGEAGVPMDSPESVPSPLRFDPGAAGADGLDRFLADYRQPEPSPEPGMGATPLAGISTDRSASSADPDRETGSPGGWDPAALARLASLQVSLSWPDSPDTSSVAGETSGQAPGLKTRGSDYAPFAEIGACSRSLADLGPLVPRPDDGIAGLFDAVAGTSNVLPGIPLDTGRSFDGSAGSALAMASFVTETRPGIAPRPTDSAGGSTTAEAEAIADLTSRLVLAVERLEQAAGRLVPRTPLPLASAPRPFPGRVDA